MNAICIQHFTNVLAMSMLGTWVREASVCACHGPGSFAIHQLFPVFLQ